MIASTSQSPPFQQRRNNGAANPFLLGQSAAYNQWKIDKLNQYPESVAAIHVEIEDPAALSLSEQQTMLLHCQKTNLVLFSYPDIGMQDKVRVRALAASFGLTQLDSNLLADDDGITSLTVKSAKSERGYLPYSDKRLLWHTDGYYNPPERRIRAFMMYCVRPSLAGGGNQFLDPEIMYILLRDIDSRYIEALMQPDVMTIPANTEATGHQRPAQAGSVFYIDRESGALQMRYTARTRSIEWKQNTVTQEAVACIEEILAGDSPYILSHRLSAGQGILCNNILHNRSAFTDSDNDSEKRLLYRARYYDRIGYTTIID